LDQLVFFGTSRLTSLFLTNNSLTIIKAKHFNLITNLEKLYLDFNDIKEISGSFNLTRLKYIKLNDNELSRLPNNVFEKLTNLEKIDLYNNYLEDLTQDPFLQLSNLKKVNLIGNSVSIANFLELSKNAEVILA